jgi:hypothetical protein
VGIPGGPCLNGEDIGVYWADGKMHKRKGVVPSVAITVKWVPTAAG